MAQITSIKDIRAQYPEYNDLSDEEIATGLHKNFYQEMPFDQFAGMIGYVPKPTWTKEYPTAYKVAQTARDVLGPAVEAGASLAGGVVGTPLGPLGTAGGAGLGYAGGRQITQLADIALGNAPQQSVPEQAAGAARDVATGAAFEMGGQLLGRALGGVRKPSLTQEAMETADRSIKAGFRIPPSQISASLRNRALESVAGKAATAQTASVRNQEVTNTLARQALGIGEDTPLSKQVLSIYRGQQYGAGYSPIANLGTITPGKTFTDAMDDIAGATGKGTIPSAVSNEVKEAVKTYRLSSFDAGDAVDAIRSLREKASDMYSAGKPDLGKAYKKIADAFEGAIDTHLKGMNNPDLIKNYREARQQIAKSFSVEGALIEGSGNVNAKKLAAQLQKGKPLTGELKTIAEFANVFPKAAQPPSAVGGPGVSNLSATLNALGGIGATSQFGIPGGIATSATMAATPSVVRSYLLSDFAQKRLANANPSEVANILRQMGQRAVQTSPALEQYVQ